MPTVSMGRHSATVHYNFPDVLSWPHGRLDRVQECVETPGRTPVLPPMLDSDANLESHEMPALSSHAASQLSSLFSEALSSLSSASSCSGSLSLLSSPTPPGTHSHHNESLCSQAGSSEISEISSSIEEDVPACAHAVPPLSVVRLAQLAKQFADRPMLDAQVQCTFHQFCLTCMSAHISRTTKEFLKHPPPVPPKPLVPTRKGMIGKAPGNGPPSQSIAERLVLCPTLKSLAAHSSSDDDTPLPAAKLWSEEQPSIPPIAEGFRLIIISDYTALLLYYLSIPTVNEDISTK
ncbi:hypothetical protein BC826DRAFT_973466 [Russula brevipes]|nr:hypothetical protein BC826DRAFT_973466 [Russula brevipes]